jgi:hypothetical protein
MLKKIATLAVAFCAVGAAHADIGPIYISYPGYCNVKQIYINQYSDVYGREIGCSALVGSPFFGTLDGASGNIYVSTMEGGVCLTAYRSDGLIKGGCTNGTNYYYNNAIPWVVSTTRPLPKKLPGSTEPELPSIGH